MSTERKIEMRLNSTTILTLVEDGKNGQAEIHILQDGDKIVLNEALWNVLRFECSRSLTFMKGNSD